MTTKLVTGLFEKKADMERALDEIEKQGYTRDSVSLLMSTATKTKEFGIEEGSKAAAGAGVGGAVGGTIGATIAAIIAIGTTVTVPGLGLVVAGPLAAALAGAGAGAATGGLIGSLVGAGIPEYRAKVYDEAVRAGGIVLGIEAKDEKDADLLEKIFEDTGAKYIKQD